jgi:hypothetical protein
MAAYAGTTTVLWSIPFGSKRAALVKVEITNYNQTGIPLTPRQAGLGVIECVQGSVWGIMGDAQSPIAFPYDPIGQVVHLMIGPAQEVSNDINLHLIVGDIQLLVIGS